VDRREFLHVMAMAAAAGLPLAGGARAQQAAAANFYEVPRFGNVHLLHLTDSHAQLLPVWFREPSVNLGAGTTRGQPPHLVGAALLKKFSIASGSAEAHAYTHLDFVRAAQRYGRVGGYAHLATLVKQLRAGRPGALLLDGGDTWQGSATALWTHGQDMVEAGRELGVDVMTGHWEFTLGAERVLEIVKRELQGRIEFLAQNIRSADFGDAVFTPYTMRTMNGVAVAIIGQAYPYMPIANPRYFVADWNFGIQEELLQNTVEAARAKGAQAVVLLSHNGMDIDLKLASRVRGIDAILGGHTHDGVPRPLIVGNGGGKTLVTNAGSNGKFLGVLDLRVSGGRVEGFQYRLLPVFANLLPADRGMQALIERVRAPYLERLAAPLAVSEGLLYRRGNFNGTFDQLILNGLMAEKDAEIAFSPGFRWGSSLLPGETIRMEHLMDQTAITYPHTTLNEMSGAAIKNVLEDVGDNLFNPDPYYQQGGDMVRVGGLQYRCNPAARIGRRIDDLRLHGKLLDATRLYKVAGWGAVSEESRERGGEAIWDLMARYLRQQKTIPALKLNVPGLVGAESDAGLDAAAMR
jgi:S-sulfosulfanyl-L-cysteine sulfohydrolase